MSEVWIKMLNVIVNVYLLWGSIQDIRKKIISASYIKTGFVLGIVHIIWEWRQQIFVLHEKGLSLVPGIILLIIAKLSKEKIGYGDGILFLILGICMKPNDMWNLWQISLLLSTITSVLMVIMKKWKLCSMVPFIPFVWVAHLMSIGSNFLSL